MRSGRGHPGGAGAGLRAERRARERRARPRPPGPPSPAGPGPPSREDKRGAAPGPAFPGRCRAGRTGSHRATPASPGELRGPAGFRGKEAGCTGTPGSDLVTRRLGTCAMRCGGVAVPRPVRRAGRCGVLPTLQAPFPAGRGPASRRASRFAVPEPPGQTALPSPPPHYTHTHTQGIAILPPKHPTNWPGHSHAAVMPHFCPSLVSPNLEEQIPVEPPSFPSLAKPGCLACKPPALPTYHSLELLCTPAQYWVPG